MSKFKFISRVQLLMLLLALALLPLGRVWAEGKPPALGGTVEAVVDGRTVSFPSLRNDYQVEVEGDLVTVTLTQTFINPGHQPVNATYLFPLPTRAAVFKMEMEVGDELVSARIQRVEEARVTYEKAKSEGKAAALLTQKRPNMFTQQIANLMPGLPVKVSLSFVQAAQRVDGRYELALPLVVGPRYQPAGRGQKSASAEMPEHPAELEDEISTGLAPAGEVSDNEKSGQWVVDDGRPPISVDEARQARADSKDSFGVWELESLPAYPPVSGLTIPKLIDEDRVGISIDIKAGQPISQIDSPTHALSREDVSPNQARLTLAEGRTIDNRDFVLNWSLSGQRTQAGLLAHKDERGGFFSLLIEPPAVPDEADLSPREMVFVLDTSGSMRGQPLEACQKFMVQALKSLRVKDYFRIVTFDNAAREFSAGAVPATAENIHLGLTYVHGLRASGGTEAAAGIRQALGPPQRPDTLRLVVFMTDGYIGNETQVLGLVNELIGRARILSFGVGSSVNRFLLEELAREGRGWSRILDPTADVDELVTGLAARLESPVLTDISIDWDGAVGELAPEIIPDLFAGQSIRIMGRYEKGGPRKLVINGSSGGRPARMPLKINLPEKNAAPGGPQAIPLIWARENIAELNRQFNARPGLRKSGLSNDEIKERVTVMGLTYNLVTTWTSFVAVSEKVVNKSGLAGDARVPLSQVKGVGEGAYGLVRQNTKAAHLAAGPSFGGGSTPEPATLGGLSLMAAAGWAALRKRRRR